MRRDLFQTIYGGASRYIALPVVLITAQQYIMVVLRSPVDKVYEVAIGAFGVTAALSAVCLSSSTPFGSETTPGVLRYTGEKLLHASVLLLQVLFVVIAREGVLGFTWVAGRGWMKTGVTSVFDGLAVLVTGPAVLCWWWALDGLNDELWSNWRRRVASLSARAPTVQPKPPDQAPAAK